MDLKPIKTKRDYQAALKRVEQLWRAAAGSTEADALDVLTLLIADYETRHFPIADPDPPRARRVWWWLLVVSVIVVGVGSTAVWSSSIPP